MKKKKHTKPVFKLWHILLAAVIIVLALAVQGYLMFLKPVSADSKVSAVAVPGAAENPDSPEVQTILKSGRAVRLDLPGCPNLCKVSDTLYRGAQPTAEGFENLKKLGIKTVVNLRDHHTDQELLATTGLRYVPVPMDTWDIEDKIVVDFLRMATDPNAAPVFVHCQHGADRTGTMVAVYRMVIQNQERNKAIWEMTHGGFGYHPLWSELPTYLRTLDVDKLKQELEKKELP
jgi:protein tyrosine/serine phosphatase